MSAFTIETPRLFLRSWREEDIAPFHEICSDPRVMEFVGLPWSREEIAQFLGSQQKLQAERGYCNWAVERKADRALLGFCGFKPGTPGTPVEGKLDIGYRLAFAAWGSGFAGEAAAASIAWGFANLPDDAIWAKTVPANTRSWGLMLRLGMTRVEGGDFDHPALPEGDPLRRHVLYRITRPR